MHTLSFLEPGHFHAALTLGERHPRVRDEIFVYAPAGPELDDFLGLVEAFNRRPERPTHWRPVVRAGDRALERLVADRPGDVAILAGRNDRKMAMMRRLHDAGLHLLADKPWLAGPDGLDDLRQVLAGGPLAAEILTGRHELTSILGEQLVGEAEIFGGFLDAAAGEPVIEMASVHHLAKMVNGRPLRRPPWFFDVRVQGDGIADIPTHMVDQAQRLVRAAAPRSAEPPPGLELLAARTWVTPVPRALFSRVTGTPEFPPELEDQAVGSELAYRGNAALSFRIGGLPVALETRWEASAPAGGGDSHRAVVRGRRAEIRIEHAAATGWERRLSVVPRGEPARVRAGLERMIDAAQAAHPGLALAERAGGWAFDVPRALEVGHERHFPRVLADFLALLDGPGPPARAASDTLAKYTLLAQASAHARRGEPGARR